MVHHASKTEHIEKAQEIWLDDLRLVRKIAAGGMAEVWEARQGGVIGFEKRLAVKIVLPHLSENKEFIDMFLDEGRLAARLDHPNICQIYKLGYAESVSTYYMAMEYIDGMGLSAVLREAARRGIYIPLEHCCQILIGACAGLDYAHAATDSGGTPLCLVHRDISPQNLMLTNEGTTKVVDFGIAKAATQLTHTRQGVLKGKYAYMSPEQATADVLDHRTDIFALGVVLWEMTTGHRLFRAENEIATLHRVIEGDYTPPSAYRDHYPPALETIVMRALAPNRENRYQNCGEFQIDLEDFLLRHGMAAGTKRLAHYLRWLMSGDEALPMPSSSQISQAVETGDPSSYFPSYPSSPSLASSPSSSQMAFGGHTPQPSYAHTPLPLESSQAGQRSSGNLPTFSKTLPEPTPAPVAEKKKEEKPRGRSSAAFWVAVLVGLFLVMGGGGFYYYAYHSDPSYDSTQAPLYWLVESEPRKAQIFVNGEAQGRTPKVILFPRDRKLILKVSSDGYEPYIHQFGIVSEQRVAAPLRITLKRDEGVARYGELFLEVEPAHARILLDGERLKPLSAKKGIYIAKRIRAGRMHILQAEADGFVSEMQKLRVEASERKELQITLKAQKEEAKEATQVSAVPAARRPTRRRARRRPPPPRRVESEEPKKRLVEAPPPPRRVALAVPAARTLKLQIGASPKSRVFLDGRSLGVTPLFNIKAEAGERVLEFRTLEHNASHTMRLKLHEDQRILHRFPTGTLWVLTRPVATIYLNDRRLGASNKPPYTVPATSYRIRLVTEDGRTLHHEITVQPGKKSPLRHVFPAQ